MRVQKTERARHHRKDRVTERRGVLLTEPDRAGAGVPARQEGRRLRKMLALDQQPKIPTSSPLSIAPSRDVDARIMALLHSILDMKRMGVTPALVFDVDNTLLDTRYRTLEAAHAFVLDGARPLKNATLDTVGYLPSETCTKTCNDDPDVHRAFAEFFDDFFWRRSSFDYDKPIAMTIELAKLAQKLGAEIYFLTGRTETFRELTMDKLEAQGLTVKSKEHLIMKSPERDADGKLEPTEPFKARALRRLDRNKVKVAGYITEGSRDMRYLQDRVRSVMTWVYLLFPIDEPGYTVRRGRKTIFTPMELRVPDEATVRKAYRTR